MAKKIFSRPASTYQQQLQQLKNRGLKVDNDAKTLHFLEKISYFRLSVYWYPLIGDKQNKNFKPNANFQAAYHLYCFDRQLRKLIFAELEKIEIAIRANMVYVLSNAYSPTWYSDNTLFVNQRLHSMTLKSIRKEYSRADEQFIRNFRLKYITSSIPSWIILEVATFGKLSMLYSNLTNIIERRSISHSFGLDDSTFESWLHTIVYIRNICAHHSRLWNRILGISPQIPSSPMKQWLNTTTRTNTRTGQVESINNRTYFVLSMIIYLLEEVNPNHKFRENFLKLFKKYPNVDPRALGFTDNWKSEPLWKVNSKFKKWLLRVMKLWKR